MILTGTEDLRVQKTIEAIQSSFKQMVCEMPFDRITVKDLCQRARINKKTFYRYYHDLKDLLHETEEGYVRAYIDLIEGLRLPDDLERITRAFILFSTSQDEAYEKISCNGDYLAVQAAMTDEVMTSRRLNTGALDQMSPSVASLFLEYVQSSSLALYRQWVADGKELPPESLADLACSLVCNGAKGLLRDQRGPEPMSRI